MCEGLTPIIPSMEEEEEESRDTVGAFGKTDISLGQPSHYPSVLGVQNQSASRDVPLLKY